MDTEENSDKNGETFKDLGNKEFKSGNYLKAIEQYTKAIGI